MAEPGHAAGPVGLILAGGGARGAYAMGALSALLPELPDAAHDDGVWQRRTLPA